MDSGLPREEAVRDLLRALIDEGGFRRARYYEVDTRDTTRTPQPGVQDAGFEYLAVLAQLAHKEGDEPGLQIGFSIPWRDTALSLDGSGTSLVVTESANFLGRHPECSEWVDLLNLHGRSWFDLPIIRDGETVGLVAADWSGLPSDLDDEFRALLELHGHRLGAHSDAPHDLRPIAVFGDDVEQLVERGCQELMQRIDATFGAVFRYEWRTNSLAKVREFYRNDSDGDPVAVAIEEPLYVAGETYLTGRAWSDPQYRYVADLENLVRAKTGWVEQKSKAAREVISGQQTKTVLYTVVGKRERRYLLRFINRHDAPQLPFLRRRREIVRGASGDLEALIDLTVANRRVAGLRTIARHAVESIHEPEITAQKAEQAIRAECVDDFVYIAYNSGSSEPTFVHTAGAFDAMPQPVSQFVDAISAETLDGLRTFRDATGQFDVRTATINEAAFKGEYVDEYLWVDSHAGDTTGILLTTHATSPPVTTRAESELRLLQTYCDLLTSCIEAMTTYISRDGAHRALGYIGHELGTPSTIIGESAQSIALEGLQLSDAIRDQSPLLAADLARRANANYRLVARQRDEIDNVMSVAPLLANMGSGELSMYLVETDLGAVFADARDRLMTETRGVQPSGSRARGVKPRRFVINVTDSMGRLPIVVSDEGLILQAATNLLKNAIKYSLPRHPPDPMVITVSGRTIDERSCAVTVENWGFGIPAELHSRIFLPFVRGQVEDKLKSLPGMGIGLYLVSTIMGAHGGSVVCRSAPTLDDPKRNAALEGWQTAFELRFRRDLTEGSRTVEIRSARSVATKPNEGVHGDGQH